MTERENILRMFEGKRPHWLPIGPKAMYAVGKLIDDIERPHFNEGWDWFGCHWLPQNALGRVITHPDVHQKPIVTDITKWKEQITFPDIDALPWDRFQADVNEDARKLGEKLSFIRLEGGIWERLTFLMGFENALMALLEEPEACREYAEAMADFKIRLHERVLSLFDYDLAIYMEDLGSAKGPLMSRATYQEIFKEPVGRVLAHMKTKAKHVGFHSCGCMDIFVPDLVEMGAELINPVQIWNDQEKLKKEFGGKVIFYGGLNNQQVTDIAWPEEEKIRAEVRRTVDTMGPDGLIIELRNAKMAVNDVNVPAILYDEFEKYTQGLYPPVGEE